MTRYECDACGNDIELGSGPQRVGIPCHIAERKEGDRGHGYIDQAGNAVSGRLVTVDLCAACANVVYGAAWRAVQRIKGGK